MNHDALVLEVWAIRKELAGLLQDVTDEMAVTTSNSDRWPWLKAAELRIDIAAQSLALLMQELR